MKESTEVRGRPVRKAIQSAPDRLPQLTGQNAIPLSAHTGGEKRGASLYKSKLAAGADHHFFLDGVSTRGNGRKWVYIYPEPTSDFLFYEWGYSGIVRWNVRMPPGLGCRSAPRSKTAREFVHRRLARLELDGGG